MSEIVRLLFTLAGFAIFILVMWFFTLIGLGALLALAVLTLIFRPKMKGTYIYTHRRPQSQKEKKLGPTLEHDEFKQE